MRHETEVRGADEAFIRIRAIPGDVQRQIRSIADEAADVAFGEMEIRVPESAMTGSPEHMPHRTIKQSLGVEKSTFAPGGLGGGGFYEVTVGAIDDPPSHFQSVVKGSGFFPFSGNLPMRPPWGWIQHRKGQDPQHEWIDDAIDLAQEYVATAIRTIHIDS